MNYIVLDLEWNQPVQEKIDQPDITEFHHIFEIIEIGAVRLDEKFRKSGHFNRLIRPTIYAKMNPVTEKLTGIQMEDLKKAQPFLAVIKDFLEWCGDDYIFCTYSAQDLYELEMNMLYYHMKLPWKFPFIYLDVQRLYGIAVQEPGEQRSLEAACQHFGVTEKKAFHRALSDAEYTAEVMKRINTDYLMEYPSLDYVNLPKSHWQEKEIDLGTHLEFISMEWEKKEELAAWKEIYYTRCPVCKKKCRKKIRWFADGSKNLCMARCEKHGLMEGVLYFKKSLSGYFALRKIFLSDENRMMEMLNRKRLLQEKRRNKRKKQQDQ